MKRKNKLTLGIIGLATAALFVSGCTANFCTEKEKSRIAYALEPGVSQFVVEGSELDDREAYFNMPVGGTKIRQIIRPNIDENGTITSYQGAGLLNDVISSAKSSAVLVPAMNYFVDFDQEVFNQSVAQYNADHADAILDLSNPNEEALASCMKDYGYLKYYDAEANNAFGNYKAINKKLRENEDFSHVASLDFENFYLSTLNTNVSKYHSCITVYDEVEYGNYNGTSIKLEKVTWKDAWGKGGHLIEGLIVYPVAWLVDTFARSFAGGKSATPETISKAYQTGVPQILSILLVTVIVRMFIFLCTFKSTLAQRKMTELQPELAKIQQKYPNSNTNQAQKQRLAEEQMRLYKKHKVNPLSQLLVLIIQFPVFIGVWGAMTGSAVLSTGSFMGLHLSASIWETLKQGPKHVANGGWWTALVLILLMSAGQFFAMKVPQWIQKAKTKDVARLGKNPAQKQQNRTANMVSYVMLAMIIVMGFTLPAAMGVYWFVGAIVSLIQTVFTSVIFAGGKKKK